MSACRLDRLRIINNNESILKKNATHKGGVSIPNLREKILGTPPVSRTRHQRIMSPLL